MKLCILFVVAFAVAANGYLTGRYYDTKFTDKEFGVKQKFIFDVFRYIHQPFTMTEYLDLGKTFVDGETFYTDYTKFTYFLDFYKMKYLPRGEVFSIYNERHLKEVKGLFNIFYYAKDFATFKKNVVWARIHLNEGMFFYALTAAVIHRTDMSGITLPSPYEIMPFKFFSGEMMHDALTTKFTYAKKINFDKDVMYHDKDLNMYNYNKDTSYIWQNKSIMTDYEYDYYYNYHMMNKDGVLSYFTEDVGLNSYYFFFQMDYGFWLGDTDFAMDKTFPRGERYLYVHQQLLARYYMERLSHGLGEIYEFDWTRPIETGYFSNLRYFNGLTYPMRHNNYVVRTHTKRDLLVEKVVDYERRLRDIIDRGYVTFVDGKRFDLRDEKAMDFFGRMLLGYKGTGVDYTFYKYVEIFSRVLLSGGFYTGNNYRLMPGVLEHFETSLRDPVFFMLYKRIIKFYFMFKDRLHHYTKDQLFYKGIKIDDVKFSKLITYFDFYDIDVSNMYGYDKVWDKTVDTKVGYFDKEWIKVRSMRLNHIPFNYNIDISSDKVNKVVVRTFIGPKFDEYGRLLKFKDNRENFVEIDKFIYDLKLGKNIITRNSKEFFYTIPDSTTYFDMYKKVMTFGGKYETDFKFGYDFYCGFPDRLVLPKGRKTGIEYRFFFIITPFVPTADKTTTFYDKMLCGKYFQFFDDLAFGYPFDRYVFDESYFHFDNMFVKDEFIFHKNDFHTNYVL